eukprot:3862541-Amphidinium_carterae.1
MGNGQVCLASECASIYRDCCNEVILEMRGSNKATVKASMLYHKPSNQRHYKAQQNCHQPLSIFGRLLKKPYISR